MRIPSLLLSVEGGGSMVVASQQRGSKHERSTEMPKVLGEWYCYWCDWVIRDDEAPVNAPFVKGEVMHEECADDWRETDEYDRLWRKSLQEVKCWTGQKHPCS